MIFSLFVSDCLLGMHTQRLNVIKSLRRIGWRLKNSDSGVNIGKEIQKIDDY